MNADAFVRGAPARPRPPAARCTACDDELSEDHPGIRCWGTVRHEFCEECSANYVGSVLNTCSPEDQPFPPKCSCCPAEVFLPSFERFVDDKLRPVFLEWTLRKGSDANAGSLLTGGEKILKCPHCNYMETTNSGAEQQHFLFCKQRGCEKISCLFCQKACVPAPPPAPGQPAAAVLDEAVALGLEAHFGCASKYARLKDALTQFKNAIEEGQGRACPNPDCRRRGVKDEECTHMTCDLCRTKWCYVCGLDVQCPECALGPAPRNPHAPEQVADPHYRHNVAFATNPKRCPMWPGADPLPLRLGMACRRWRSPREAAPRPPSARRLRLHRPGDVPRAGRGLSCGLLGCWMRFQRGGDPGNAGERTPLPARARAGASGGRACGSTPRRCQGG